MKAVAVNGKVVVEDGQIHDVFRAKCAGNSCARPTDPCVHFIPFILDLHFHLLPAREKVKVSVAKLYRLPLDEKD